jgi:hypothetical protein
MDDISARRDADHRLRRRDMDDISGGRLIATAIAGRKLARDTASGAVTA